MFSWICVFSIFSRMLNHIVADYYYLFNFKLNLQISKDKVSALLILDFQSVDRDMSGLLWVAKNKYCTERKGRSHSRLPVGRLYKDLLKNSPVLDFAPA